ncbi:universal stress protein [Hymenobacter aquaticus]|uniref:Universal stress protein n=1 Tax=Hymenobacter aquaticus TaxID=1867101 RepID=A0A4Z0Q6J0_9BACT|nr:universal stress protein [Hymenobacter aquaticus]TGE25274.1 universal stress protein [Hymenobacter aquaticus]
MPAPLLVLTDFTPAADAALQYAAALAAQLHTPLVLLHVNRNSIFDPESFTGKLPQRTEGEIAVALDERMSRLTVPVVPAVTAGRSTAAILEVVEQHRPALLVLGRPEVDELPDELVTTTSLDLLQASQYPLLVVPVATAATAPRRLSLAADGNPFQLAAPAQAVQEVLQKLQARLTIVHVVEPEDDDSCTKALESVRTAGLLTGIEDKVHTQGVRNLDVAKGIEQAAHTAHAELLVLVARRHSVLGRLFHRSITAQVIRHARLPVLALPTGR